MPVPESGTPAAAGYAEESGIPFGQGFVKNAYVGRTFIQPSQTLRQLGIRLKLNALEHMVRGKRLVVVDDSIVRGNTQRAQVRMLREAGALEVHVRISSPPVKWPCFYGIDFATRAELIANGLDVEEIAASVGADTPRLHLARGDDRGDRPAAQRTVRRPASPASTRSRCPTRACSASTCSRPSLALARRSARPCPSSTTPDPGAPVTDAYAEAGVSIESADKAVELMKVWIDKARRPEVIGGIGGFAGLFDASALTSYRRPLLATSTDGVGTKVAIAQAMDVHDTIGFDLVGMVVDDLVVCGAEPLFMTDYIAIGRVVPERIAAIVKGIAEACVEAGCALVGGETAEHPGLLEPDEYDVAGATTGVVEADRPARPGRVRPGDVVVAMASSGLHSNGYSLVRHVLLEQAGWALDRDVARARPHPRRGAARADPDLRQGVPRAAPARPGIHAMAHVTGGGLAANLARVMPGELARDPRPRHLDAGAGLRPGPPRRRRTPGRPRGDAQLRRRHGRPARPRRRRRGRRLLAEHGVRAWVAGEVDRGRRPAATVELVGQHPGW